MNMCAECGQTTTGNMAALRLAAHRRNAHPDQVEIGTAPRIVTLRVGEDMTVSIQGTTPEERIEEFDEDVELWIDSAGELAPDLETLEETFDGEPPVTKE